MREQSRTTQRRDVVNGGGFGAVAQMGERRPCKAEVVGSIPISSIARVGCTMCGCELDIVDPTRRGGSEFRDL